MMDTEFIYPHVPVLVDEVIHFLSLKPEGRYLDATIGCGGHALELLKADKTIHLLGIDRDREAVEQTRHRLSMFSQRVCLRLGNYSAMKTLANEIGWNSVDGILMDLGMSSLQTNKKSRGFSFQTNGPLDMRMNQSDTMTAHQLLHTISEKELTNLLRQFGEEPKARKIASGVITAVDAGRLQSTSQLAEVIRSAAGVTRGGYSKTVARCFQAIRIAINDELVHLKKGLDAAVDLLNVGGRMVVISFHSLEDRLVKNKFRFEAAKCICPPGLPICKCGKKARLRALTTKPVTPGTSELLKNRRARPAKLRAAEKL